MATKEDIKQFDRDGYLVLKNFITEDEITVLKAECAELIEKMDPAEHNTVFSGVQQTYCNDYFMNSSDKIGYFFEENVLDVKGKLTVPKAKSIGKIGHALHVLCPNFRKVTHGDAVRGLAKSFDYKDPVIVQSMYIFKQPGVGAEVVPHQDATYLYCEEEQKVMGLWIALEDATLDNGCLWFIPGSHKSDVHGEYRMIRNENMKEGDPTCVHIGKKPEYNLEDFIPCPVKKGCKVRVHSKMATKEEIEQFNRDGYFILKNFITEDEIPALKAECAELIEKMDPAEHHTVFSTTKHTHRDDYFMNSSDKIGYFFEENVLDDKGKLTVPKAKSINKIGHALHVLCPNFRKVTHGDAVRGLAKSLDYKDPVIVQSMYIFKQPGVGGEVVPHQDATYLYCEEEQKVMGLWIALEDATLDNGCLWFIPGSHKSDVHGEYRMIRNENKKEGDPSCVYIGEKPEYNLEDFVPCPVKKGDLVIIHGLVVHRSEKNTSQDSRHIYTFHMFDNAAGQWSNKNWLQPTSANTFTHLYDFS